MRQISCGDPHIQESLVVLAPHIQESLTVLLVFESLVVLPRMLLGFWRDLLM